MYVVGGCEWVAEPLFPESDCDCVEGGCRGGVEADGPCGEGGVAGGGGAPESLGNVGGKSVGVELLESGGCGGAFGDESCVFRCLAVQVWCWCARGVRGDGSGVGGFFEDGWAGGACDAVVCVAGWDGVWVDPALSFGGVELQTKWCDVLFDGVECVVYIFVGVMMLTSSM